MTQEPLGAAPESGQPVPPAPSQQPIQQPAYAAAPGPGLTAPAPQPAQPPAYSAPGAPAPQGPQPPTEKKPRNILGLIALIVAGIGFIFACIPGALILGWILLPIGFILALVSLFLPGKAKNLGIIALIVSIVGTIVGFIVFFAVVSTAFNDALNEQSTVVEQPADSGTDEETTAEEEPAAAEAGTRENPYPLGTAITSDEWEVTINSVTFAANDAVAAENEFNEAPAEGSEYILVNATVTYVGSDTEGSMPAFVQIEYVTPTGETVNSYDSLVVPPDQLDTTSTLYNGGTASGNVVFAVPSATAQDGVIAVAPGVMVDTVFYAVK